MLNFLKLINKISTPVPVYTYIYKSPTFNKMSLHEIPKRFFKKLNSKNDKSKYASTVPYLMTLLATGMTRLATQDRRTFQR